MDNILLKKFEFKKINGIAKISFCDSVFGLGKNFPSPKTESLKEAFYDSVFGLGKKSR